MGNFEEGKILLEKGGHFVDSKNRYALGWVELCYGLLFFHKCDGENVVEHVEKSIKHLDEAQAIYLAGLTRAGLGFGHYLLGELGTAEKHVENGLKYHRDAGMPIFLSWFPWILGMIYFDLDELKKAKDSIEEAVRISQNRNEKANEAITRIWLGRILGKSEVSTNRGEEYILKGMKISKELKLKPFTAQGHLFLGEIYIDTDQDEKALENIKTAEAMFKEMGMDYYSAKTKEVLERF